MGRQALGTPLQPGPFDLSPTLCYAQRPLCPSTNPGTFMHQIECESPMGQNFIVAVSPYGGCNQFVLVEVLIKSCMAFARHRAHG